MRDQKVVGEWENAKESVFRVHFLSHLNKNINSERTRLICGDFPNAPYQATVYILTISRNWEKITYLIDFTQNSNNALLARITLESKSQGFGGGIRAGSYIFKTKTAFGYAGQNLGKFMAKKIK